MTMTKAITDLHVNDPFIAKFILLTGGKRCRESVRMNVISYRTWKICLAAGCAGQLR